LTFKCPTCQADCINVKIGLAEVQMKTDPRLVSADKQQMGAMITAQCATCALQHALVIPLIHAESRQIELAPQTRKLTAEEAERRGLHRA
jgi:hypothetical protein